MSQEKDDKSKASGGIAGKPGALQPADPGKRPYATIDLKATELPGAKSAIPDETSKPASAAGPATAAPSAAASAAPASATTPKATNQPTAAAGTATGTATGTAAPSRPAGPTGATGSSSQSPSGQPKAAATAKTPSSVAAWLPSLVSGAVGAILTLVGLGSAGLIGGDPASGPLGDRLAALEKSTASRPQADVAAKIAAVDARMIALEGSARDLAANHASLSADAKAMDTRLTNQTPAAAAAADRLQKLEQMLADLSAAAVTDPQRGRIPALAQITTKLGDLDTQLTTRSATLKAELSQELEKRLSASAETAETVRARLAQRTQSLEQTLKSVADDTTALRTSVDGLKGDLEARFKAAAKPADVAAALDPVTTKMAGLEKNLATVVRSEQDRNATAGNILLSIELANLKRALDRGGKYAAELAAVKKVGGDKLNLAVLESAQNSGVASLAVLTTEFRGLAYTMLDAEADPAEGSVLDRMLAGAKSVVRVRKVVHGADDKGTEATIGRMESNLRDARLGDVLDESKKLGAKPLAVASAWLQKIEARYAIETSVADLEKSLKSALAGSSDPKKGAN